MQHTNFFHLFLEQFCSKFKSLLGPDSFISDRFSFFLCSLEENIMDEKINGKISIKELVSAEDFYIKLYYNELLEFFLKYPVFNDEEPYKYPFDRVTLLKYK